MVAILCEETAVVAVHSLPAVFHMIYFYGSLSGGKHPAAVTILYYRRAEGAVLVLGELRTFFKPAGKMADSDLYAVFKCGGEAYRQNRTAEGKATVNYPFVGHVNCYGRFICFYIVYLCCVMDVVAGGAEPVSI